MGVWDYISGTADSIKRNAPDLTPVKALCCNSYGYSKAGVSNIHNAVKVNGGKVLSQYGPSGETMSKIPPFVTNLAVYSAEEALKFIPVPLPGGASGFSICKAIKRSWPSDANKSKGGGVDVKALQAEVKRLNKELGECKNWIEQMEMNKKYCSDFESAKTPNSDSNSVVNRKPEDVIRVFMMKEFIGRQLLDDMIVHGTSPTKK